MFWLGAYIVLAFLWACYSVRKQIMCFGWYCWWRIILVAVCGFVFCPLCMVVAIIRGV